MAMTLKPKPNHPNEKRFATFEEKNEKSKQQLLALPKSVLHKCLCIISEESYFKEDKIVIEILVILLKLKITVIF